MRNDKQCFGSKFAIKLTKRPRKNIFKRLFTIIVMTGC